MHSSSDGDSRQDYLSTIFKQETSDQGAKPSALTHALQGLSPYTHRQTMCFATAHIHGDLHRQRGLLSPSEIKTKKVEILTPLEAIWLSKRIAIIHFKGDTTRGIPQNPEARNQLIHLL